MMKIYEQTDDLIVREMTENDLEAFLELMKECGTAADFTVNDIRVLWKFRNKKGDIQCTITSTDGKTIYGFCGIFHISPGSSDSSMSFFEKYESKDYREQVDEILTHITLGEVFKVLST